MKKIAILLVIIFNISLLAKDKIVIATLNWPPYVGESLYKGGLTTYTIQKVFESMGYETKVEYHSWKSALSLVKNNKNYYAVYPAYYSKEREKQYHISQKVGSSIVGFAQKKDNPIEYTSLKELKKYNIGTVKGYINEREFDTLVKNGLLKVKPVSSDLINLKKLVENRLDTLVIDKLNMQYLINSYEVLKEHKDSIELNKNILDEKHLYVLFKRDKKGKKIQEEFDKALKSIDLENINKEYFKR
jgi:polar amino acid transport system substrate-binding protein